MKYSKYSWIYPPRPETKIPVTGLGMYQRLGYWAQTKRNGTCTVIFSKGDQVIFKTRHNEDHKMWVPLQEHTDFFSGRENWNVYVAELLHSKVSGGPKNELYIFDQIVRDGEYLVGKTFSERQMLLHGRWSGQHEDDQIRINKRITLSLASTTGFAERFKKLKPEDEGLVLKDPKAKLRPCYLEGSNAGWQVKCRTAGKNFSF